MFRRSKILLALLVLVAAAGISLAYAGMLEPLVSTADLPGPPPVAIGAIAGVVLLGVLVSHVLDRRAWRKMGNHAGLTPNSAPEFTTGPADQSDKATLTGTVDGRAVRARTYSTSGGQNRSSKTYTVVEAELGTPVEWHASFGVAEAAEAPDDPGIDAAKSQVIDGVGVRGDVSEDVARSVLGREVKDAVTEIEGPVSVGDVKDNVVGDMLDELDSEADGLAGSVAKGMLNMASDGEDGPSRTVEHRDRGLLTDERELRRRIDAVTVVADAVTDTSAAASQPNASLE
ncbi:MAG: hypothetical protein ABEJ05_01850 [Haloglomus sp.]